MHWCHQNEEQIWKQSVIVLWRLERSSQQSRAVQEDDMGCILPIPCRTEKATTVPMKEKPPNKVIKTKARTEPNGQTEAIGKARSIRVMFRGFQKDQWNQSFVKKFTLASFLSFPYKKVLYIFFSEKCLFTNFYVCGYAHMNTICMQEPVETRKSIWAPRAEVKNGFELWMLGIKPWYFLQEQ